MATSTEKKIQRTFNGIVVSDKMSKTIVVRVDSLKWHQKYRKQYRVSTKYKVHDEKKEAKVGQTVQFVETRPISKEKRCRLVKVIS